MSGPVSRSDESHHRYEQACDQAIAMCDGNLRSTIKALIMANEYLEIELDEVRAAVEAGRGSTKVLSGEPGIGSLEANASTPAPAAGRNAA
jgi:hypothetical protein